MNSKLEKYADLIVRAVTVKAYEAGAREVILRWIDELSDKIRYEMAHDGVFDEIHPWRVDMMNRLGEKSIPRSRTGGGRTALGGYFQGRPRG